MNNKELIKEIEDFDTHITLLWIITFVIFVSLLIFIYIFGGRINNLKTTIDEQKNNYISTGIFDKLDGRVSTIEYGIELEEDNKRDKIIKNDLIKMGMINPYHSTINEDGTDTYCEEKPDGLFEKCYNVVQRGVELYYGNWYFDN